MIQTNKPSENLLQTEFRLILNKLNTCLSKKNSKSNAEYNNKNVLLKGQKKKGLNAI